MKPMPRLLIVVVAYGLIIMGISQIALRFFGDPAVATITSMRREGGERSDGKSGRYTYAIGYVFTLPNGDKVEGFAKEIGAGVYLKADGSSVRAVRYFSRLPRIKALESNTGLGLGQVTLVLAGLFLPYSVRVVSKEPRDKARDKANWRD